MTSAMMATDVVVRDGSTVTLRPTGSGDLQALERLPASLSAESRYVRFLGTLSNMLERVGVEAATAR